MRSRGVLWLLVVVGWAGNSSLWSARAQEPSLPREAYKNGERTLRSASSLARQSRTSVVKLDLEGRTVGLAAVVDKAGLVVTKASEIRSGKLTAWLGSGREVPAQLLGVNEENDVALVRVDARGLKPVEWASSRPSVGQWVVTPGVSELPQAIGVVSVPARKIRHPRALIGIRLARNGAATKVESILSGLGAEKAGLKSGDDIRAVNGTSVESGDELIRRLRDFREGQSVVLKVRRGESEFDMTVPMMRPEGEDEGEPGRIDRMGGEPSQRAQGFELVLQHDTVLQPWQCGGPLLDLDGKTVGLNIARAGRVASYALPAEVAKRVVDQLKSRHAKPSRSEKAR
ncbi:MAG: PDZ domain-containing protein [Verrucomicrobia bacterium]|nr:PDZ domain-containing protein [Verrucomicrobiota bacterium]